LGMEGKGRIDDTDGPIRAKVRAEQMWWANVIALRPYHARGECLLYLMKLQSAVNDVC
jgi:hypothetical protein